MDKHLLLHIICITALVIGCTNKAKEEAMHITGTKEIAEKSDLDTVTGSYMLNICRNSDMKIDYMHPDYLIITRKGFMDSINLAREGILNKLSPSVKWVNKDYACITTWHSQSQARHIFIPVDGSKQRFVYLDKNITHADSITNNIVYIDTVFTNRAMFRVENLKTRKNKTLEIPIGEENGIYPHFKDIMLIKDKINVITELETLVFNIAEIY